MHYVVPKCSFIVQVRHLSRSGDHHFQKICLSAPLVSSPSKRMRLSLILEQLRGEEGQLDLSETFVLESRLEVLCVPCIPTRLANFLLQFWISFPSEYYDSARGGRPIAIVVVSSQLRSSCCGKPQPDQDFPWRKVGVHGEMKPLGTINAPYSIFRSTWPDESRISGVVR
jgi:hypothetical protein